MSVFKNSRISSGWIKRSHVFLLLFHSLAQSSMHLNFGIEYSCTSKLYGFTFSKKSFESIKIMFCEIVCFIPFWSAILRTLFRLMIVPLDEEIKKVLTATAIITENDLKELKYEPVELKRKFKDDELSLKIKFAGYVNTYFTFIREEFQNLEGKNNFIFSVLSSQIKACFEKMESVTNNKYQIFNQMVDWLMTKTLSESKEACEIVISFFVQNCEVFREITE